VKVLVDTSIWSLALRRKTEDLSASEKSTLKILISLIQEVRVVLIGPIRQEILSGITDQNQFTQMKEKLRAFEDLPLTAEDYELAAEFYNSCRKKGIQGSHIDFLICAVAQRNDLAIFTDDRDFEKYSKQIGINLFHPEITY